MRTHLAMQCEYPTFSRPLSLKFSLAAQKCPQCALPYTVRPPANLPTRSPTLVVWVFSHSSPPSRNKLAPNKKSSRSPVTEAARAGGRVSLCAFSSGLSRRILDISTGGSCVPETAWTSFCSRRRSSFAPCVPVDDFERRPSKLTEA